MCCSLYNVIFGNPCNNNISILQTLLFLDRGGDGRRFQDSNLDAAFSKRQGCIGLWLQGEKQQWRGRVGGADTMNDDGGADFGSFPEQLAH